MKSLLITVAVVGLLAGVAVAVFNIRDPAQFGLLAVFIIVFFIQHVRLNRKDRAVEASIVKSQGNRPSLTPREFATTFFAADERQIAEDVRIALEEVLDRDMSRVRPHDRFIDDLHIDHFDDWAPITILEKIEKKYRIEFTDEEAKSIKTIGEFVDAIGAKAASQAWPTDQAPITRSKED